MHDIGVLGRDALCHDPPGPDQPYFAGAEPPFELNDYLLDAVMQVLRYTAWLDVDDETTGDISPASIGNNTLGTNDGEGYERNPSPTSRTSPSSSSAVILGGS